MQLLEAVGGCSEEIPNISSLVAQDTGHTRQKPAWKTQPEPPSSSACTILRLIPSRWDLAFPGTSRAPGTLPMPPVGKHGAGFNLHH